MNARTTLLFSCTVAVTTLVFAQSDTGMLLQNLKSPDPNVRMDAFYRLLPINASSPDNVKLAMIQLLSTEIAYKQPYKIQGVSLGEAYSTYFGDLVTIVVSLKDARSVQGLVGVIDSGGMVTTALANFAPTSIDSVIVRIGDIDETVRNGVAITLTQMLQPAKNSQVADSVAFARIANALHTLTLDVDPDVSQNAHLGFAALQQTQLPGDVNHDGKVDCSDISIVKAAFGMKTGQPGFDVRADVNFDGVVDIRDLAFVSQHLPVGMKCP